MFKQLTPLDSASHSSLHINPDQPFTFASELMAAPVMSGEANLVAREYALVFPAKTGLPLAILGIENDCNAYVNEQGIWQARYLPAHVRRYPFMLGTSAQQSDNKDGRDFTVLVDLDAPHFKFGTGKPLFTAEGQPGPALLSAQKLLVAIQNDSERTLKLVQQLDDVQLLVQQPVVARPQSDQSVSLDGLRVVDRDRLNSLDANSLQSLQLSGALSLAYAHILSLSNLKDSVLVKSRSSIPGNSFELPGVDDGIISFGWTDK